MVSSKKKSGNLGKKGRASYSKGQLNRLVDCVFHPLYPKNEMFRVLDGLVHGMIEQDPLTSAKKFLKYNIPELIKKASKRSR